MKSDGILKHLALAFAAAAAIYIVAYHGIEHRRTRHGPWQVAFTNDATGSPALLINQPALSITNVQIVFPGAMTTNFSPQTLTFATPRNVPYDLPFGRCLFMDTTFLPGTIVFHLFGHEIQLIPRVLTIDGTEQTWRSDTTISLAPTNSAAVTEPRK
jgi:hypothetical protein